VQVLFGRESVLAARHDEMRCCASLDRDTIRTAGRLADVQQRLELCAPLREPHFILLLGHGQFGQLHHLLEHVQVVTARGAARAQLELHVATCERIERRDRHRLGPCTDVQLRVLECGLEQQLVQFRVVLHVNLALALLDLVERRLGDVNVPSFQ
jgi:hypothetical protein